MPDSPPPPRRDAELLRAAATQGVISRAGTYLKLSGPGWLQSAITLGGGSLSGSLYLGIVAGVSVLWVQPVAMLIGIVMLSAIGYVTMATGSRPFEAINRHVNPVLGWSWALASLLSSMVWAMPQYSLSMGVLQQNLLPNLMGPEGSLGGTGGRVLVVLVILVVSTLITWSYGRGHTGVRIYERVLKTMVGLIVLCFAGVIFKLTFSSEGLDWSVVFGGFIPDPSLLWRPADAFAPLLEAVSGEHRAYWSELLVARQRDVAVAAAATAVGINMTFLFPYSILRRGWGREFIGFARFDLFGGMLIPFTLATSCVVIAAASQFYAMAPAGLVETAPAVTAPAQQVNEFNSLLTGLVRNQADGAALDASATAAAVADLGAADRHLAATLVKRDAFDLANALSPFTGSFFSRVIFGFGVIGMTLSTITILMLISGMVVCEMLGRPHEGWTFRLGSLAAATGALGPFVWSKASFWLAVPTSIFGFILMPIAYLAFFLLMNQRSLLGNTLPTGGSRVAWNLAMGVCVIVFTSASAFMLVDRGGTNGLVAMAVFLAAIAAGHFLKRKAPTVD